MVPSSWSDIPASFKAVIRGSTSAKPTNLLLNTSVPGLGRVRIKFGKKHPKEIAPLLSDGRNAWTDPERVILLRGTAIGKSWKTSAAAAIYNVNKRPYLFISFFGRNSRRLREKYYKIKIPLTKQTAAKQGQITRVSRPQRAHESCKTVLLPGFNLMPSSAFSAQFSTNQVKVIKLALYGDKHWFSRHGDSSNAVISATVNEMEALYSSQLNLEFAISHQVVLTNTNFGTSASEAKLANFQQVVTSNLVSGLGKGDAYHLFTGQELDKGTIGLSYQFNDPYLGTICRLNSEYSFGLTQFTSDALTPLTFAHELGHSLGAIHPEEDRLVFPNPPSPSIMTGVAPLNPSDSTIRKFSVYSVNQITGYVTLFGQCLNKLGEEPIVDGNEITQIPLSLDASISRKGDFNAILSTDVARPECSFRLRGSRRRSRIKTGLLLAASASEQSTLSFTATIKRKTKRFNKRKRPNRLYLAALIQCPDNSAGLSSLVRIRPDRIRSNSAAMPTGKWFYRLRSKLN